MLMLCLHRHSLGSCIGMGPTMDPRSFIVTHVDVVVRGLLAHPAATTQAAPPAPKRKAASRS
jgi:hypothetical protein